MYNEFDIGDSFLYTMQQTQISINKCSVQEFSKGQDEDHISEEQLLQVENLIDWYIWYMYVWYMIIDKVKLPSQAFPCNCRQILKNPGTVFAAPRKSK